MKKSGILLLGLLILALMGVVIVEPSWLMLYLVRPVARLLWLIYHTILAVDQAVWWGILAVGGLFLLLRLIPARQEGYTRAAYLELSHQEDRFGYWSDLIDRSKDSPAAGVILRSNLERLLGELNSLQDEENDISIDLTLPKPKTWRAKLPPVIRNILQPLSARRGHAAGERLQAELEQILSQMESRLELPNDQR